MAISRKLAVLAGEVVVVKAVILPIFTAKQKAVIQCSPVFRHLP